MGLEEIVGLEVGEGDIVFIVWVGVEGWFFCFYVVDFSGVDRIFFFLFIRVICEVLVFIFVVWVKILILRCCEDVKVLEVISFVYCGVSV